MALKIAEGGYEVIALDLPGHGKSTGRKISAVMVARALVEVGEQLGPFHAVVAHSFGGLSASLAVRNGMVTSRLCSISAPAQFDVLLTPFVRLLRLSHKATARMRRLTELEFGDHVWELLSMSHRPQEIALPTLVIHDREDAMVPCQLGRDLAAAWPNSRYMETEGLGHHNMLTDPVVTARVLSFLDEEFA